MHESETQTPALNQIQPSNLNVFKVTVMCADFIPCARSMSSRLFVLQVEDSDQAWDSKQTQIVIIFLLEDLGI